MGKLLRVGGMRRCCSPVYTPRGYMLKGWRARPSRGAGRGHRAASSLSGGINNVTAYYMDDTLKDKSVMGGIGMFMSGAGASGIGALTGGVLKTRANIKGYAPFEELTRNRFVDAAYSAGFDAGTGAMKTTLQYGPEQMIKGQPWEKDKFFEKVREGTIKDFSKSYIKSSVKMSLETAKTYRDRGQWYAFQTADAFNNRAGFLDRTVERLFPVELMARVK